MRILMLQRFDLSSVSCARRVLCQAQELLRRGHEVYLTDFVHETRHNEMPMVADMKSEGGHIIPLKRNVGQWIANYNQLRQIDPKPDIVHLWKAYPDASLPAIGLSRSWSVPLHYDWDDWEKGIAAELAGAELAGWAAGLWDRHMPSLSDTMTTASLFLQEKAIEYGMPREQIWDAPVGADVERFYPRERDGALLKKLGLSAPVIIYIGQLEVASYAGLAVDVLARVREEIGTASLLVAGGGRKLPAIQDKARAMGLGDHAVFTDYVPADSIPDYLSLADVALAPFEENDVTRAKSPLKIAEYLAMGMPIVASDVGDVRRMAERAGSCVPCGDIGAMAEKTTWLLKNPAIRRQMSEAGLQSARGQFNWKTHTDALESAYQYAIEHHHG